TQPRLHVFFRRILGSPSKNFFELRFENCESVGDRNFQTLNPEILCQGQRIENAAARRKLAGHGNAGDIVATQRIHCNRSPDSGINPTAQSEHGTFETALGPMTAQTEAQAAVKYLTKIP